MADTYNTSEQGLGVYHLIEGNKRVYQPAKGNFFQLVITNLPEKIKLAGTAGGAGNEVVGDLASEVIRLTVNKTSVPHFTLGEISIRKGNSVVYYASTPEFNEAPIEIDDMIGVESKAILEAWQALAYDVTTDKGGRAYKLNADGSNAGGYKADAELIEYTSDYVQVRSWKLKGCWVKEISEDDYDKENDGLRRVQATIRYDRATPIYENTMVITEKNSLD